MTASYDPFAASSRTGLFAVPNPSARVSPALVPGPEFGHGVLDPRNPIFWFGVVLAATLGLVAVSGSIKVGPVKAGASIEK